MAQKATWPSRAISEPRSSPSHFLILIRIQIASEPQIKPSKQEIRAMPIKGSVKNRKKSPEKKRRREKLRKIQRQNRDTLLESKRTDVPDFEEIFEAFKDQNKTPDNWKTVERAKRRDALFRQKTIPRFSRTDFKTPGNFQAPHRILCRLIRDMSTVAKFFWTTENPCRWLMPLKWTYGNHMGTLHENVYDIIRSLDDGRGGFTTEFHLKSLKNSICGFQEISLERCQELFVHFGYHNEDDVKELAKDVLYLRDRAAKEFRVIHAEYEKLNNIMKMDSMFLNDHLEHLVKKLKNETDCHQAMMQKFRFAFLQMGMEVVKEH
eukprot:jgi/Bigna1/129990/aug1.10_g4698